MTAYFKRGMTEAEQRALSATLPQSVRDELLAKALAALPKCRDSELDDCINLTPATSSKYDCQTLADGWIGDFDKMEAAYDALPRCNPPAPAPAKPAATDTAGKMVVGGLIALALAAIVKAVVDRKRSRDAAASA